MKWFFALAFMCFFSMNNLQAQVNFYLGTFSELQREAVKKNKPYFVVYTADWCQPCKKMDRDVFQDNEVGKYVNTHYLAYKVNGEKGQGVKMAKQDFITGYPTIILFNKKNVEMKRFDGYREKENFLSYLKNNKPGAVKTKFSEFR